MTWLPSTGTINKLTLTPGVWCHSPEWDHMFSEACHSLLTLGVSIKWQKLLLAFRLTASAGAGFRSLPIKISCTALQQVRQPCHGTTWPHDVAQNNKVAKSRRPLVRWCFTWREVKPWFILNHKAWFPAIKLLTVHSGKLARPGWASRTLQEAWGHKKQVMLFSIPTLTLISHPWVLRRELKHGKGPRRAWLPTPDPLI